MHQLIFQYKSRKKFIRKRLQDFKETWQLSDRKIFSELCFCICTPQSKAVNCDKAIKGLEKTRKLFNGNFSDIRDGLLSLVRFHNNKARYIINAREFFSRNGHIRIKREINTRDILLSREFIVKNIKGIGYKEASHFLRNIGFGKDLAILDVHIFKNLIKYKVIKEKSRSLTREKYLAIEDKLRKFSKRIKIPMDELDLLFWSNQTGELFK